MEQYTTSELTEELLKREGISRLEVKAHRTAGISTDDVDEVVEGPAFIIINQD